MKSIYSKLAIIGTILLVGGVFVGCVNPGIQENNHINTGNTEAQGDENNSTTEAIRDKDNDGNYKAKERFSSEMIEFSFSYDPENNYTEKKIYNEDVSHSGEVIFFESKSESEPSFDVITRDFELKQGVNFRDIVEFNESGNPIHIKQNVKETEEIERIAENTFQIIGFSNYECSLSVSSHLVYVFPEENTLKYAIFRLGSANDFLESDLEDICKPKTEEIEERISNVKKEEFFNITNKLKGGLEIIKSFSF